MEIVVTVSLDIDDKIANKRNPSLKTVSSEQRQTFMKQGVQNLVEIALKKHFEDSEGVKVGFVKGDIVLNNRKEKMKTTQPDRHGMIKDKFEKYHAENPEVFQLFLYFAQETKRADFAQYSAWAIMNLVLWHRNINKKSLQKGEFKIPNDYIAWYARKAMKDFPQQFKGFFKLRKMYRL